MSMLRICVFVGSVREGRMADRVVKFVKNQLEASKKYNVDVVDPAALSLPLLKQPMHFYPDQSLVPEDIKDLNKRVEAADAYLIVSPEYNRSIPPALVNTMDHIPPPSYSCKPSGLVMYSMGPHGGCIAGNQLRPFLTEIGALPVTHMVAIGSVHQEISESGTTENKYHEGSFKKLMDQIDWHGQAMKNQRDAHGKY